MVLTFDFHLEFNAWPVWRLKSDNKVVNRFYRKEKSTAWPLLFSTESVTKFGNRFQPQYGPGINGQ